MKKSIFPLLTSMVMVLALSSCGPAGPDADGFEHKGADITRQEAITSLKSTQAKLEDQSVGLPSRFATHTNISMTESVTLKGKNTETASATIADQQFKMNRDQKAMYTRTEALDFGPSENWLYAKDSKIINATAQKTIKVGGTPDDPTSEVVETKEYNEIPFDPAEDFYFIEGGLSDVNAQASLSEAILNIYLSMGDLESKEMQDSLKEQVKTVENLEVSASYKSTEEGSLSYLGSCTITGKVDQATAKVVTNVKYQVEKFIPTLFIMDQVATFTDSEGTYVTALTVRFDISYDAEITLPDLTQFTKVTPTQA